MKPKKHGSGHWGGVGGKRENVNPHRSRPGKKDGLRTKFAKKVGKFWKQGSSREENGVHYLVSNKKKKLMEELMPQNKKEGKKNTPEKGGGTLSKSVKPRPKKTRFS